MPKIVQSESPGVWVLIRSWSLPFEENSDSGHTLVVLQYPYFNFDMILMEYRDSEI